MGHGIHFPFGGLRLDTCEALKLERQLCQHETSAGNFTSSTRSWHIMPRVYPPIEGKQPSVAISPSLNESVAGFTAGVVSTLVVHPFDVIKTRLQIEQNEKTRPGGSLRVMRSIAQEAALHGGLTRDTLDVDDVLEAVHGGDLALTALVGAALDDD